MFYRLPRLAIVAALACSLGLHWGFLQSMARVGMVVNYSQGGTVGDALAKTFDGKHPCALCKAIAAVLASYANFYRAGNADRWLFAAAPTNVLAELAPRLDLMVSREAGGSTSHNLRTVVLDGQGRIRRQFDGNQWTAEELAREVVRASAVAEKPTRQTQ